MAHSYAPGLTVTDHTTIQRRRQLPLPGKVLVAHGERVDAHQVVARAELPGNVHSINVANILGIAPDEIDEYLLKKEGDSIQEGEILAENKPFLKWLKTEIQAPIHGTVDTTSKVTGQVLLREPPRPLELQAYIDGTIVDVVEGEGVTIETTCAMVQGIFGIGGETRGELIFAVQAPDEILSPHAFTQDMGGKIVVCGSFLSAEAMNQAKSVGIAGLIVGGIHDKDLRDLLGYDLGVAITGTEQVGFTLVLTEGFGTIPMAGKTFSLLTRHTGHLVSLSGATQIRAGVIRPEIIIPQATSADTSTLDAAGSPLKEKGGIEIGDLARIIRDPLFGNIGKVVGLPSDLKTIETESSVRVLEIALPDGTVATIPRTNIEIIEEQ